MTFARKLAETSRKQVPRKFSIFRYYTIVMSHSRATHPPPLMSVQLSSEQYRLFRSWQRGREAPRVDHLTKHLQTALKMIHHLHQIGVTSETSKLPRGFQQLSSRIIRQIRPAQPSSAIQGKFRASTDQYLHGINSIMRDHYKEILVRTSKEVALLQPSNTTIQKASQVALAWQRSQSNRKLEPKVVHAFRVWTKSATTITTRDQLSDLWQGKQAQHPVGKTRPAPAPRPAPTSNRFSALTVEKLPKQRPAPKGKATPGRPTKSATTAPEPARSPPATTEGPRTVNAQGPQDPLSNFYMDPLEFQGTTYKSTEHAFQTLKALHFNTPSLRQDIMQAPTAKDAKALTRVLKVLVPENTRSWDNQKEDIMRQLLHEKSRQCPTFRKKLLETGDATITHKVPDSFWGTTCHNSQGTLVIGRDKFSSLLMELRATLRRDQTSPPQPREKTTTPPPPVRATYAEALNKRTRASPPDATPTKKQKTQARCPSTPAKRTLSLSPTEALHLTSTPSKKQKTSLPRRPRNTHQMSPTPSPPNFHDSSTSSASETLEASHLDLTNLDLSFSSVLHPAAAAEAPADDLPDLHSSRAPPPAATLPDLTKAPTQSMDFRAPKVHSTRLLQGNNAVTEIIKKGQDVLFQKAFVILGDNNLKLIDQGPTHHPVQIVSYCGANISSLYRQHLMSLNASTVPKKVIISIGINNTVPSSEAHLRADLKKMCSKAHMIFPEATLWIPLLNYSRDIANYHLINKILCSTPPEGVGILPDLPPHLFQTTKEDHQWTTETANRLLKHWIQYMNL